jgi:zinc protease
MPVHERRRRVRGVVAIALLSALAGARVADARLSPKSAELWDVGPGTKAILVEDHRTPLVEIRITFPVGLWSPWAKRFHRLDEAFALQLLDTKGTLRARADRLGADLTLTTDARMSTLSIGCQRNDLDSALALAHDVLTNRDIDHREIFRRNTESDLEWSGAQKNPQRVLSRTVRRTLFDPDDPRRKPFEKPDHVTGDLKAIALVRDSLVRSPGRTISFAGDLTRAEAESKAAGLLPPPLAAPPSPDTPTLRPLLPAEKRPREQNVELSRLTQVYLALAREAPPITDPEYPALIVADHVLGGHFYSRLYKALRHGSGDTYATGTIREIEPATGAYAIWTYSRTENAAVAEKKLAEVLRVFHDQGITEEERVDAIGFLRGRLAFTVQSPGQVLDRILWDRSRGLDLGYRDALPDRCAALTLEEINAFIRKFYDPERFTWIRVRTK